MKRIAVVLTNEQGLYVMKCIRRNYSMVSGATYDRWCRAIRNSYSYNVLYHPYDKKPIKKMALYEPCKDLRPVAKCLDTRSSAYRVILGYCNKCGMVQTLKG